MRAQSLTIALIWLAVAVSFVIFFKDLLVAVVFLLVAGYFFYRAVRKKPKPDSCCGG